MAYKSYKVDVEVAMKLAMEGFCEGVGILCEGEAKNLCPVGENYTDHIAGNLRRSITHEVMENNHGVYIGVKDGDADYAECVEKGIGQSPQPYLEPGCVNAIPKIIDVARKHYDHLGGV